MEIRVRAATGYLSADLPYATQSGFSDQSGSDDGKTMHEDVSDSLPFTGLRD